MRTFNGLLLTVLLVAWPLPRGEAKSYSSGGHSYSSHSSRSGSSSSHSSSRSSSGGSPSSSHSSGASSRPASSGSSGSKSSSSGSTATHSSSSSTGNKSSSPSAARSTSSDHNSSKTYHSSSGKSYSSGSTWDDTSRRSYTSGKSYSSENHTFSSTPSTPDNRAPVRETPKRTEPASVSSSFNLDSAAARARKEEASQKEFNQFKESQLPKPRDSEPAPSYAAKPPPLPNSTAKAEPVQTAEPRPSYRVQPPPITHYERRVYIPDTEVIVTRPVRRHTVFYPYESRPVVIYRDPYNSLFWWWLLDRSLEDRAQWAYHHRYDMDPGRYQTLLAENQELEARVQQLESQQVARNPDYVPPGLDRDLMYSDRAVEHAYSNRPTTAGRIAFGVFAIPVLIALVCFFIWFIFIKRWQPSTSTA